MRKKVAYNIQCFQSNQPHSDIWFHHDIRFRILLDPLDPLDTIDGHEQIFCFVLINWCVSSECWTVSSAIIWTRMLFRWFALLTDNRYMIPTVVSNNISFVCYFSSCQTIYFKEFHFLFAVVALFSVFCFCLVIATGQGITMVVCIITKWFPNNKQFQSHFDQMMEWKKMFKYFCWWRLTTDDWRLTTDYSRPFHPSHEEIFVLFLLYSFFHLQSPLSYSFDSFFILFK